MMPVGRFCFLLALPVAALACDGTLSGMHRTRGEVPVLYAEPATATAAEALPPGPKEIRAAHLLVMHRDSKRAPPSVTRTRDEAKDRADEALAKVKSGVAFEEVVAEYSDEPGAAERGGDLGKFSRKNMVKGFSDAAFKLDVGHTSDIVETEFGFHIIRRSE